MEIRIWHILVLSFLMFPLFLLYTHILSRLPATEAVVQFGSAPPHPAHALDSGHAVSA